jgi:hypothetical protein
MKMTIDYKEQIPILVELQKCDSRLMDLEKQKEAKPLELEEVKAKVEKKRDEIASLEQEIKELKVKIKEKELELKSGEEEIKKLQQKLFQVKTNKEYQSLLMEIEGKKADNSLIEDNILELMEEVDKKELQLNEEKGKLKEVEEELRREEKRIADEIKKLEGEIEQEKKKREEIVAKVVPELYDIYSKLLKNRGGVAIVPVVNEACGGCHLSLRPQTINEIKMADRLVTCERCSRILYLNE